MRKFVGERLSLLVLADKDSSEASHLINGFLATLGGLLPGTGDQFNFFGEVLKNLPIVGTYIQMNQLRDAQLEAADAALEHQDAIIRQKDALDGTTLSASSAATSVQNLAEAQKEQAAQAIIAEWNAQALGDAYDRVSNAANLAAERTDMLRRTQDGQAYTALIASTGAWTQSTAYEALNKGLERAGLGASATDERMKKLTTSERAKGTTAKGVTTALHGETVALDEQAAAAKKLQAEIDAIANKGKGKAGSGKWSPDDPKKAKAKQTGTIGPETTTNPLFGTFAVGGTLPPATPPATVATTIGSPPSLPPLPASALAIPTAQGFSFAFYLDCKTISDVVEVHLGRKNA